ncbi:MAG: hypothetical protein HOA57_03040 [Candidatus Magasanikbacteria bacterium]|jgi:uncharacterized membrane protein|nr:hypothetical protein [Candidatus Magasanikbacteria bacterium]MBT4315113.1 hypothetical protein [Candidatus Magasanikbacteria bacterium]MBT4547431.1 hypothetical protein [Candidatus Magasanikbacteria bacterium]MBT6819328.1 hypothetical protein [Candidatus Magasanikbacteria bacterium]
MEDLNIIRSIIFAVAGLIVILFPKKVYKFQSYVLTKLHIKHNLRTEKKYYNYTGAILIIIAIVLFAYSATKN